MVAIAIALASLVLLTGCAEKGRVQVDWEKVVEARLKGEVSREGEIDMRWITLPPQKVEEGVKKSEEEGEEEIMD